MTNTQITTKDVKIPAHDGGAFNAYVAYPEHANAQDQLPAIILIQEIFGVNQEMREKCHEYAQLGYIAICPDLFWRIEENIQLVDSDPEQLQRAFDLFSQFDVPIGIEDLKTTLGYARQMPHCNEKVGAIGYCLGGHLSYRLATNTDINAAIGYYGVNIDGYLGELENLNAALLLHIAGNDEFVGTDAQNKIITACADHDFATTYHYEGQDHAFARGNGIHYNESAAKLANTRTREFLNHHLK